MTLLMTFIATLLLVLSGCTYGTYYATGSYANQENHNESSACAK